MHCTRLTSIALWLLISGSSYGQIASTFDTDADGWTFFTTATSIPVNYNATNGNPGGYVSTTYSANTGLTTQQWFAPSKFNGNRLASLGMNFHFDAQQSFAGTVSSFNGDVRIENGGNVIVYSLPVKPALAPAWSSYSIKLDETGGWHWANTGGALATRDQIIYILANVTSIEIRGAFATNASHTAGLDNVILELATPVPPPSIASFSPMSGNPGTALTINGTDFGPTVAENEVLFGSVSATITSAGPTQLKVTVPLGATHGPVIVINKTTGRVTPSAQSFNPTFADGGRIIPASFDPKVDIPLSIGIKGIAYGDVDGDGWVDLAVANNTSDALDIYRNLGVGGDIVAASFAKVTVPIPGSSTNGTGLSFNDLDGDGKVDAITSTGTSPFNAAFVTFRNISTPGNIAFEAPEYWPGGSDESPIALVADLDGDGRAELMGGEGAQCGCVRNDFWFNQNISTPGNIEFGPAIAPFNNSVINGFTEVAISDLDNDGKGELLVTHSFGTRFTVLRNTSVPGVPSFANAFTIQIGNASLQGSDLNGDGKNDLVWKTSNDIYIRLNTNSGGALNASDFTTEVILTSDIKTYGGVAITDMNGDDKPDIIATDNGDAGVFENVYSGGAFDAAAFIPVYLIQGNGQSTYPTAPMLADLNGDQRPEIIMGITNVSPDRISIYENKNVHAPVISINTVSPLGAPVGATVTITGNHFSTVLTENQVRIGGVPATVLSASKTELTVAVPAGASYGLVSVTRDRLTSAYRLPFKTTFSPGVNFDNTRFATPIVFTLTAAGYDIDIGDLNLDGKPDVLAQAGGIAYAFRNTHPSGPINGASLVANDTLGPVAQLFGNPRLNDLDGDGYLDAASNNGRARKNTSTLTDISFTPNISIMPSGSVVTYDDFNQDGKTDIVLSGGGAQLIFIENRTSTGSFSTGTYGTFSGAFNFSKPATGGGVVTGDFDGDGFPDAITTNPTTDNVSIFHNRGSFRISTAQFDPRVDIAVGDNPGRIYAGDLDVDGKQDFFIYYNAGSNPNIISVFHNQSTPGTIAFNRFDVTIGATTIIAHISDLDGDGKPEILTTSETTDQFFILKNNSTPGVLDATSFAAPFSTAVNNPRGINTADINLDGKPEIIITATPNSLLVYENLVPTSSITITTQPTTSSVCDGTSAFFTTTATGTTNITYQWQFSTTLAGAYNDITNASGYSNVAASTLSVNTTGNFGAGFYRCKINGDLTGTAFSNPAQLTIVTIPTAPTGTDGARCGPGTVVLSAAGATSGQYRWYTAATGGTSIAGETNNTFTTPSVSSTTNYYVAVSNGTCESQRVAVQATINPLPAKPTITANKSTTICIGNSVDLSAPLGFSSYAWSNGATTAQINVANAGAYTVQVTDAKGCTSASSDAVSVAVQDCSNNQAPTATSTSVTSSIGGSVTVNVLGLLEDPDDNLDLSTLRIATPPQSGALATIDPSGTLTIDYNGIAFSGTDNLQIEVCDIAGSCAQAEVEIEVIGDITIYNALSPSGANPIFVIQYIELLPDTKNNEVTIFDRWQNEVWRGTNYDNSTVVFSGASNSGTDLPPGTYFYKIEFGGAKKAKTGFISLKR